ncbi:hypothetical protein KO516_06900 [Citreicella sp. C3M06]|uniref:hypothetical protein n=1 Tax=Citreicella sp. C3M06 TaxID=2841564 RepID=UPI001C08EE3D|nr:hypothetical protein [Citreicella sp. C3M06]MBU2960545.1 hypothetical protein [Citreicella sp. C3M06]
MRDKERQGSLPLPDQQELVTAVAQRYRVRFLQKVEKELQAGTSVTLAWREVFRRSLREDGRVLFLLEGAMLASAVMGDHDLFDRVTKSLGREPLQPDCYLRKPVS